MKPPKWARKYFDRAADALGLHAWSIQFYLSATPNPHEPAADASCEADAAYLCAKIGIRPEAVAKNTAPARDLIVHELLHVVNAEHDETVEQIIDGFVAEEHRSMARRMLTCADERRVVRLSRCLIQLIPEQDSDAAAPADAANEENSCQTP